MNYKFAEMVLSLSDKIIAPSDITFDATNIGCDTGSMFGISECIDYNPSDDGSIWFTAKFSETWNILKDINIEITHNLNGVDTTKVVRLQTDMWIGTQHATPVEGTPTVTGVDTITSTTDNQGKVDTTVLATKMLAASLSSTSEVIVGKITRTASNVADTYGGTFQLSKIRLYQV
jgi:hypothetical protein